MACPICDGTMQNLGTLSSRIFWCARCGTLKTDSGPDTLTVTESPIWIRQIIRAANFLPFQSNVSQHTVITVSYDLNQEFRTVKLTQMVIR